MKFRQSQKLDSKCICDTHTHTHTNTFILSQLRTAEINH